MSAMTYSVSECFMAAFAAGLLFALVYEALRIVRLLLPLKAVVFACDIAFFVLAALAVTKLSLSLGNYIRFYTVAGFGAGVFSYIVTIGRLMNFLENAVIGTVQHALASLFKWIGRGFKKAFGAFAQLCSGVFGEISKISSALRKKTRRHLKKAPNLVYNKESFKDNNGGSVSGHVIKAAVRRSRT